MGASPLASTIFPLYVQENCVHVNKCSEEGIKLEVQTHGDQGYDESFTGVSTQLEVKVSMDDGETWNWRRINMGGELDDSGLEVGEIVQLQGEKYRVSAGDEGLRIEPIRKSVTEKKKARRR